MIKKIYKRCLNLFKTNSSGNVRVDNTDDTVAVPGNIYDDCNAQSGDACIEGIIDASTGAVTGEVMSGNVIAVNGKGICVVPPEGETPESCITYINTKTKQVTVQEEALIINVPSKIVLQLPMLPPGIYVLTIKTLYSGSSIPLERPNYITSKIRFKVKQPSFVRL